MLFIPKTSNFYFYDNCRYVQAQVFYNLPYVSNHILNEFKNDIKENDFKLCFMSLYKNKRSKMLETISSSNIYLIPSIYPEYPNLNHMTYSGFVKRYYQNSINSIINILSANTKSRIHFLYASELLNCTTCIYSNENLTECVKYINIFVMRITHAIIYIITYLWAQTQMLLHNMYVSYCRYILYTISNGSDGFVSYLLNSSDSN